ncbi:putative 4-hydroxy-2-oxoglutarate aldolase, mitochondrial [Rhizoctonia solani]|uniref:Putative 4-hydroxy-2-oxoglutarate aldolase, mitochondrial n=1 Tax=Rhizoctonia solani TaxID=456999 RepID=A0A0K6GDB4_9AGAM|nr:putative 4-hydroxy-2-oxoglutarate aldolase, mitochondrial [Rhizoctonia solani]
MGTTGEAVALSREERNQVTATARAAVDKVNPSGLVIVGTVGAQSTLQAIELCQDAAQNGGDYALVLPPGYFAPALNKESILGYYRDVAEASPIPILVYSYPAVCSGLDMSSELIAELATHPRIVGIKHTDHNLGKIARLTSLKPTFNSEFSVFGGASDYLLSALAVGAQGAITGMANVTPRACVKAMDLWRAGKQDEARELAGAISRGEWALGKGWVTGTKYATAYHRSLPPSVAYPRKPLPHASEEQKKWAETELVEINGIAGSSSLGSASLEPASGPQRVKPRRAIQACSNCRKHKLRCLGGWPCNRCTKQKISCDFERPSHPAAAKATETIERLEQLEASVTSILASMSSSIAPTPRQHSVVSDVGPAYPTPGPFHPQQAPVPRSGSYPFATFPTPSDDYSFSQEPSLAIRTEIDTEFLTAPTQDLDPPPTAGPSTHTQNVTSPITNTASPGTSSLASRKSKPDPPPPSVESRLRTATDPYSAPFKGVLHRPSVWNNSEQEQSRGVSPEPVADAEVQEDEVDNSEDDPIGAGIVTKEAAIWLFESFATRCHPFIPVVDFTQRDAYESIRHKSSFLFSTILAIAARFDQTPTAPPLASLAERHLSHTLLRKQHCLADVQATLLLAGWGLQPGGGGPDAWLLTGHAWRMGRRLGLWKKPTSGGQGSMPRWRTWMCLFAYDRCLSLGFGRPASQFDTDNLDVDAFIAECESRASGSLPASTGDFFIASQVQLMYIGRDLCAWLETMRDKKAGWSWEMAQEMNERLDKWSRDWTWSSSRYLPYLNSSTRIARMYSEHVRLCLNSLALRTDLDGEAVAKCLDKALNSAMAIIQMQHDSATTDGGMSYSIDYLTIVLATAAVFLIRLVRSQPHLLDTNVGTHYIKMAVSALEKSERSQTKLSTHLAKTVRDMARVAGLTDAFPHTENSPERTQGDEHANELDKIPLGSTFEALLAFQNQTDPSYLELLFGSESGGAVVL